MAVQWLGNVQSTGRDNLGRDVGEAINPMSQILGQYYAETPVREKQKVDEWVQRVQSLDAEGREKEAARLQSDKTFRNLVENYAPDVIGEDESLNLPENWELSQVKGDKAIFTDTSGNMKVSDIPEGVDFTQRNVTIQDNRILVYDENGEIISNTPLKDVESREMFPVTLEDGSTMMKEIIYNADGTTEEVEYDAGVDLQYLTSAEQLDLSRIAQKHQISMDKKKFTQQNEQFAEEMSYKMLNLEENKRQFGLNQALEMSRMAQQDEQFWAKMEQNAEQFAKSHDLSEQEVKANIEAMKQKIDLAEREYDLSKENTARQWFYQGEQLKNEKKTIDLQLEQMALENSRVRAALQKYDTYGAVYEGGNIVGVKGRKYNPDTEEYEWERLDGIPSDIAGLMLRQQEATLELEEQDKVLAAQDYAGLAGAAYNSLRSMDVAALNSEDDWGVMMRRVAESYLDQQGEDADETVDEVFGKTAAHARARGWLDIPVEDVIRTGEAWDAYEKELAKIAESDTLYEPGEQQAQKGIMRTGNLTRDLLHTLTGNDTLYKNVFADIDPWSTPEDRQGSLTDRAARRTSRAIADLLNREHPRGFPRTESGVGRPSAIGNPAEMSEEDQGYWLVQALNWMQNQVGEQNGNQ